jgi:putative transposase
MSRRGNCCDNPTMESFWSTLKPALVYRRIFATRKQAKADLFDFIVVLYNRNRHQTAISRFSPALFESKNP